MIGLVLCRMSADKALGRVRQLNRILRVGHAASRTTVTPWKTLCSDGKVSIGDVSKIVKNPNHPELVPTKHLPDALPQSIMRHLRWIMQKDSLGQDVFLIGPPGPLRRAIAMQYLELTKREIEYIALTRDTTESDLKQRREIRSGTAYYIDQCAVKAATEGRVLVLEGVEKAERNVLPVLNNLLENREMQLEDGRFLCAAQRYDKLLKEHSQEELDEWRLVRVSEDFRVIALGLPVPRYRGNPLDPPLRSRFQARDVNPLPFKDQLEMMQALGSGLPSDKPTQILSFAATLRSSELSALGLPDFPLDNLYSAIKILDAVPGTSVQKLLYQLYPYSVFLGKEGKTTVEDALKKFELLEDPYGNVHHERVTGIAPANHNDVYQAKATVNSKGKQVELQVPAGTQDMRSKDPHHHFIITSSHEGLLADMMLTHMVQDFCLIGPKGCGKSILAKQFANSLGYSIEPVMLYQDMTSRDLLQQRATLPNGDTMWRMSPLITAAIEGGIALLDGLHRVNPSTLAVLHRLVHDREVTLFDGTRLLRQDKYEAIKEETGMNNEEMANRSIHAIHPSFRMIALAEPPVIGSSTQQWLNSELLTLFLFHHIKPLSYAEELQVLQGMVPEATEESLEPLLKFTHLLRNSSDPTLHNLSSSLSTRNLLRIVHRMSKYPDESLHEAINKACLSRFLPQLAHQALDTVLTDNNIHSKVVPSQDDVDIEEALTCKVKDGVLRIGHTTMPVYNPENGMMVPDTLFYENAQHLAIMEDMLKDFALGEHLLLIGNQGVGKNKLADRFLHLLNKPRQYLQLHRDTTVQTLTLQPSVRDGVIVYEDSPLVKAVKYGHVLVVDEADKAPTNVTCILKSLVESGEMILADGRKIVSGRPGLTSTDHVLVTHPDFRMIVLANRPGFPFLGNDFFGALGDIFSCHAVDNPNIESEMQMLSRYGPNVPESMLRKLVLAFSELRNMADQGMIAYPYSTREVVNMVKHLENYPNEGLATVVNNVFDFDAYNKEMREQLVETLHKHGIPLGANPANVNLAKEYALPAPQLSCHWRYTKGNNRRKLLCPVEKRTLKVKGPAYSYVDKLPLERIAARSSGFTEQLSCWNIPLKETGMVSDVTVSQDPNDETIHVVTCSPVGVYHMPRKQRDKMYYSDLYNVFPGLVRKSVKAAALGPELSGHIVIHEEIGNVVLVHNTNTAELNRLYLESALDTAKDKIMRRFSSSETKTYKMCSEFAHENWVAFYQQGGNKIDVIDLLNGSAYSLELPIEIASLHLVASDAWLVTEGNSIGKYLLTKPSPDAPVSQLSAINELLEDGTLSEHVNWDQLNVSTGALNKETLSQALGQNIQAPNRILASQGNYGNIAVGFPELMSDVEVYTIPRHPGQTQRVESSNGSEPLAALLKSSNPVQEKESDAVMLPEAGQIIKCVPVNMVPKDVFPENKVPITITSSLEIVDLADRKVRYIPVPSPSTNVSRLMPWAPISTNELIMTKTHDEHLVTVDRSGTVRVWETGTKQLAKSLDEWQRMLGADGNRPLQITREKELGKDITSPPKHGKIDPKNTPHVGGSQWAGGTGGQGTAGLGGVGGPYRLDAGHDVFQVSDLDKENVPPEILAAAREMAEKAFKERLREIDMSDYDAEMYEKFSSNVRRQVKSLKVILESLQAKGKERQWLKHQSAGELDETKLIEGLTGEKSIYKRRGDKEPEPGSPQVKPKRLRLVVDVSGSMYRFNGYDGRLDRMMESALMVMEAFEKYDEKFTFDIVGHSGEDFNIVFVNGEKPPKNNKERLNVIKKMHAHAQFCMSGDNTLEAAKFSIEDITNKDGDEYFVIVLSDANLDRYAISPTRFSQILTSDEQVNAYALFIGSLGNQADVLVHKLPAGKGFVCMDLKDVPQILQRIFTSTFLSS